MTTILDLSDLLFNYNNNNNNNNNNSGEGTVKTDILRFLTEHQMAPLYESLCRQFDWTVDETLLANMR